LQYRKLGETDIEVSAVAFGAWALVGGFNWGDQDEEDSLAALRAAYDAGVTLFDTAEGYGNGRSEELIGQALHNVRDQIVIATKASSGHLAPDQLRQSCERSLRALRTDRIDLYQVHWPNREIPVEDTLPTLEELKEQGKIRAYGISNFGKKDLSDCLACKYKVCSNQMSYSLLFRAIEYEVQPLCEREQISILCYSALMQGLLTGKFANADEVPEDRARTRHFAGSRPHARHGEEGAESQTFEAIADINRIAKDLGEPMADVSIAWLLAQRGVTSAIVGGRNADQARRNAHAADLVLEQEVIQQLSLATDSLKDYLGDNADMWQGMSRIQ
jgi:aryl-alcohol dehydrogenase-like predicted oxidoreductase